MSGQRPAAAQEVPHPRHANLPATPSPLVGRAAELAGLRQALTSTSTSDSDQPRLITLTGPGGTGKTRLALETATVCLSTFADGVYWVSLAPLRDWHLVAPTIATRLGFVDHLRDTSVEELAIWLGAQHVLIVLDNFEHLTPATAAVGYLLANCPRLRVLVTSREPLHLEWEQQWPVGPLAAADAVSIFMDRARAVDPNLQLTHATEPTVTEICRRLDGLPLAIELAAARSRVLTPHALLARLEHRLDLLRSPTSDRDQRHRSLRAMMDWSHDLLTADEQKIFRRIAIFNGGASLEGLQPVVWGDALSTDLERLEYLESLIDKSLLLRDTDSVTEPRFRMLETVRQYALERLEHSGEAEVVQRRYTTWFAELAQAAGANLTGPDQVRWLDVLEREIDNLRSAVQLASQMEDWSTALSIATALPRFWYTRGSIAEGRRVVEELLPYAEQQSQAVYARALDAIGLLRSVQGDRAAARTAFRASVDAWRSVGHRLEAAHALINLGVATLECGEADEGATWLEQARDELTTLGQAAQTGMALFNLAEQARHAGDFDAALGRYAEAERHFAGLDQPYYVAMTRAYAALALHARGEHVGARMQLAAALRWYAAGNHKVAILQSVRFAGLLLAAEAQWQVATRLLASAEAMRGGIGYTLEVQEQTEYERAVGQVRTHLGEAAFGSTWSAATTWSSTEAVDQALRALEQTPAPEPAGGGQPQPLSPRELEVAALVAEGLTNREIAERLIVSERTVDTHVDRIRNKLGVRSRVQIAGWFTQRA